MSGRARLTLNANTGRRAASGLAYVWDCASQSRDGTGRKRYGGRADMVKRGAL